MQDTPRVQTQGPERVAGVVDHQVGSQLGERTVVWGRGGGKKERTGGLALDMPPRKPACR